MLSKARVAPTLPVVDLERAKKFYRDILGLKASDKKMAGGDALFECGGGTTLYLYQRPPSKADHTLAEFWVEDLEAEMAGLRSKGVVFEEYDMPGLKTVNGVATMGDVKGAWFKDTEGNILALSQMG